MRDNVCQYFHAYFLLFCPEGCGGYADNSIGAVSCTGHGESILKVTLARLILSHVEQGKVAAAEQDEPPPKVNVCGNNVLYGVKLDSKQNSKQKYLVVYPGRQF